MNLIWWRWRRSRISIWEGCIPDLFSGDETKIDAKVVEIVREAHTKALQILKENETKLHELAKYLYENETITGEEFMQILQAKKNWFVKRMLQKIQRYNREKSENVSDRLFSDFFVHELLKIFVYID